LNQIPFYRINLSRRQKRAETAREQRYEKPPSDQMHALQLAKTYRTGKWFDALVGSRCEVRGVRCQVWSAGLRPGGNWLEFVSEFRVANAK
jgi:hypothetical protein